MEFVAAKKDFMSALIEARGIPEQKNLSNVMANILLESVGTEAVRLTAMSNEVTMTTTFPARVGVEGQMAISYRPLAAAVRALPADVPMAMCARVDVGATLSAARTEYLIPGILATDMPARPPFQPTDKIRLPREMIVEMVERVAFAMSSDDGRPNLNGIYLRVDPSPTGTRLEMVATDGHRLSRLIRFVATTEVAQALGVIIHRKGITELKRFIDGVQGEVSVEFQRNAVIFSVESGYMMVRLIELEYPKYMRVFPSEFKWTFVADRAELQRVLARVAVVAEDNPAVRLKLEPGHMALTAWDPDKGEARSDMDVEYSGEALDIGLDNRFMLDALAALRGERVTISGVDIHRAVRVESPTDDGVTQIIMPIR